MYSRLSELNKITGIFDYIPENTNFPYVVFGRIYITPETTKTTMGERIEITLDIWSGAKGKRESIEVVNSIDDSLSDDLKVPGADVIEQKIKSIEILEETNDLFHGTVVFEILLDMEV